MDTAGLFKNGRNQAVRLPKKYALRGEEVYMKKINGVVVLIPKNGDPWSSFGDSLDKFSKDFRRFKREDKGGEYGPTMQIHATGRRGGSLRPGRESIQ